MCLAIPGKITAIRPEVDPMLRMGSVSFNGIVKEINLSMTTYPKCSLAASAAKEQYKTRPISEPAQKQSAHGHSRVQKQWGGSY
jgi:hypothetical protein